MIHSGALAFRSAAWIKWKRPADSASAVTVTSGAVKSNPCRIAHLPPIGGLACLGHNAHMLRAPASNQLHREGFKPVAPNSCPLPGISQPRRFAIVEVAG